MFKKKEMTKGEAYELRAWLADFSERVESTSDDGQKVIYRLGRVFGKLKEHALDFEESLTDLRVKHGKFNEGKPQVDVNDKDKFDAFKKEFEELKATKVKVDFLSEPISEDLLEDLKGVKVSDYDYLPMFLDK